MTLPELDGCCMRLREDVQAGLVPPTKAAASKRLKELMDELDKDDQEGELDD